MTLFNINDTQQLRPDPYQHKEGIVSVTKRSNELQSGDIFFGGSDTEKFKNIFSIDYNFKDKFRAVRVYPDPDSLGWATKVEAIRLKDNQRVVMVLSNHHFVSVSS